MIEKTPQEARHENPQLRLPEHRPRIPGSPFCAAGETLSADELTFCAGGKGLNQSVAAARAGARVIHAGAIGPEGGFLCDLLGEAGADVSHLLRLDAPTGHAIIQVAPDGQNAILVYGGANRRLSAEYIDRMLALGEPGDLALVQNETNAVGDIIRRAAARGLRVVFNPSPFPADPAALPLERVSLFMVNALEAAQLAARSPEAEPSAILDALQARFPQAAIVMTLGSRGAIWAQGKDRFFQPAFPVQAVDTTGAGDTFCGYFLAGLCRDLPVPECLKTACAASAIAVSRPGAAPAIPQAAEVAAFFGAAEAPVDSRVNPER